MELRGYIVFLLAVQLASPSSSRGESSTLEPSQACIAAAASAVELLDRSDFASVAAELNDASPAESERFKTWLAVAIRELGYPEDASRIPPSMLKDETKKFYGISFSAYSLQEWKDLPELTEIAYTVHFSHEREGSISLELVEQGPSCRLAMFSVGLPRAREDARTRLAKIASMIAVEIGDGGQAH